ncbi:hypothetical protein Hte_002164 [Hypoxylon texense]
MVWTRSGARSRAQAVARAQPPDEELNQQHNSDSQSSDDDDEDIPYNSPRKSVANPMPVSLDHRRNQKRQLEQNHSTSSSHFKRRKIEHVANSRDAHSYPTPTSSTATLPAKATRQDERRSSSHEDVVPAGLINSVNAALKQNDHGEPQKPPESPTQQLMSEAIARDDENEENDKVDEVDSNHEITASPEPEDHEESLFVSNDEPEESQHSESVVKENGEVPNSPILGHDEVDVWDVPTSPQQLPPLRHPNPTSTLEKEPLPDRRTSQRRLEAARSSQINKTHATEYPRPASQSDGDDLREEVHQLGVIDDAQQKAQEDTEDDNALEHIDGLSSDDENLGDIDLSAEETFAQDVSNFRARHPGGYKGTETFDSPPKDDDVTVTISFLDLKQALKLMGHCAWAGLGGRWFGGPFNCEQSETGPVQALLQFLTKLERLLQEAPKAPDIAEQNVFLSEHGDLLSYYFSKIGLILSHIRQGRKEILLRSNDSIKKRDRMSNELVSHAIPMLFHVILSAWHLGGHDPHSPSFTTTSIGLLMRVHGWIGLLYRPLLRGLSQDPTKDESKSQKEERLIKIAKRQELEGYLKGLRQVLEFSLDELEREERRRDQELYDRCRSLERQKEIQAQEKRNKEEMMKSIEEKKWRSLMSLRGIHIPLSQSPIQSSARGSPISQILPRPQGIDSWSMEEKRFLFRELQKSYPDVPDLSVICVDIDRTIEDVEAATEELLGRMLKAVCPDDDAAGRAVHVKRMMDDYRLTYGP